MSTPIPDLWPSDLVGPPTTTPVAILRRQGDALGTHTQNFVLGEVETRPIVNGTQFEHNFVIQAPFLRFRFPLLRVTHGVNPYPLSMVETDLTKSQAPSSQFWHREAKTELEFQDQLREFFALSAVKSLIGSLIAQSNEIAPDEHR